MEGAKKSIGTLRIHKDDDCEFGHSYDIVATFPAHEALGKMDGAQVFIDSQSAVRIAWPEISEADIERLANSFNLNRLPCELPVVEFENGAFVKFAKALIDMARNKE